MGMNRKIWHDGRFIAWEDATVHVLAQSIQRGSLAFDYVSVYDTERGSAIFRLPDHLERLIRTCEIMGLPLEQDLETLIDACVETVRANPGSHSIRICAVLASIEPDVVPIDPHLSIYIAAYDTVSDIIGSRPYERRPTVALKIEREKAGRREDIIPPNAKIAASYTAPMTAKWRARKEGFDDVLLLDEAGWVTEAPTANIFAVKNGTLYTPPGTKVVLGVTRRSIMRMAIDAGIEVIEDDLSVDDLRGADELFLTATSAGVWPVLRLDQDAVGNGDIGALTASLRSTYRAAVTGKDERYREWLTYTD